MMSLSVDKAGAARALAMAGARHWPAHLGERPAVEAVSDPELRSRLSAWAMATLALVGCEGAVNVDRAQVAALGERLRAGEYYEEEPEEGETSPKRFPGYADAQTATLLGMFERAWEAPTMRLAEGVSVTFRDSSDPSQERTYQMRGALLVTPPGAAETARAGEDSGAGTSEPIEADRGTIDDVLCGGCGEVLEARQHKREGGLWSATCHRETCRWGWVDCDYRPSVSNVLAYGDRLVSMRWVRAALERWERRHEQARPVLSEKSRPVLPEVLSWLRDRTFHGKVSREHAESLREALERRTAYGVKEYGLPLHSHTGRDVLHDLEEELVDAIQYAMQAIDENGWEVNGFLHGILTAQLSAWCDYQRVRGVR
jgi:hypothetical protein